MTLLSGARNAENGEKIGLDFEIVNAWFTAGIFGPADMFLFLGWQGDIRDTKSFNNMEMLNKRFKENAWVFLSKLKKGEIETLRFIKLARQDHPQQFVIDAKAAVDQAQVTPGGIDLNTDRLEMNVKEEGAASFSVPAAGVSASGEIQGLLPVIIGVEPAQNVRMILGLADTSTTSL